MLRLLLILLCCAPLSALELVRDPSQTLSVHAISAEVSLVAQDVTRADYRCVLTLHNPGEAATFTLRLPHQTQTALLKRGEALSAERSGEHDVWRVQILGEQTLQLECRSALIVRRLPHLHVLGVLRVEFPLQRVRGFDQYPQAVKLSVLSEGLPPEVFSLTPTTDIELAILNQPEAFSFDWFGSTATERLDTFQAQLDEFHDDQKRHDNRAYTETLVTLADLHELMGTREALADLCAKLSELERDAGKAITHCGPWAKWRKHVPWQLRRFAALNDSERRTYAPSALQSIADLWQAYTAAEQESKPASAFPADRFGSYHDYNWPEAERLHAWALQIIGAPRDE